MTGREIIKNLRENKSKPSMTRDEQKSRLVEMLTTTQFKWRSIEMLSRGAQADLLTTRALLAEIGARRSIDAREVYCLEAPTGEAVEMPSIEDEPLGGEGD